MDEIVEAELEADARGVENRFKERGICYGDHFYSYTDGKEIELTPEYVRHRAYNRWGSIISFLPDSEGFAINTRTKDRNSILAQEWQEDVFTAIKKSGVDEMELRKIMDNYNGPNRVPRGYVTCLPLETIERLIKPVYIELRRMGYTSNDLDT